MDMNPLSLLEKLINEHGSASILRDNLVFVRDQLLQSQSDEKDARVEKENLQSLLQKVTCERDEAKAECKKLNDRIANILHSDAPSVVEPGPSFADRFPSGHYPPRSER